MSVAVCAVMTSDLSPLSDGFPRVRLLKVDKDPVTWAYKWSDVYGHVNKE